VAPPTNQYSLAPPMNSMTAPMATMMMEADRCGSQIRSPTMARRMTAKGRMPVRKVCICPLKRQISAEK
jgi:hypothetical protein